METTVNCKDLGGVVIHVSSRTSESNGPKPANTRGSPLELCRSWPVSLIDVWLLVRIPGRQHVRPRQAFLTRRGTLNGNRCAGFPPSLPGGEELNTRNEHVYHAGKAKPSPQYKLFARPPM